MHTAYPEIARQCEGMLRGCTAKVMGSMMGTNSILVHAVEIGKSMGWVKPGDKLVAIHGMRDAVSGASNMLKVLEAPGVNETKNSSSWPGDSDLADLIE